MEGRAGNGSAFFFCRNMSRLANLTPAHARNPTLCIRLQKEGPVNRGTGFFLTNSLLFRKFTPSESEFLSLPPTILEV
jgi:hypothetical protein